MLARTFKSAAELGLTDLQLEALIKVLDQLERGELHELTERVTLRDILTDTTVFSMRHWCTCLRGHANRVNQSFSATHTMQSNDPLPIILRRLFHRANYSMEQATTALRDFLTHNEETK